MTEIELQEEEREVLSSIYEGDDSFKEIAPNIFQYKFGENDSLKSFLLEIKWDAKYPDQLPNVNLDAFYNKHVVNSLKEKIINLVLREAEQYLGMSMTYSLFEFVKEKFEDLINEQPECVVDNLEVEKISICDDIDQIQERKAPKKEQLTKAQKRRQWNRVDNKGEKPRGWNWVDIVKHLSQTGPKETSTPNS